MATGLAGAAIAQPVVERGTISSAALAGNKFGDPTNRAYAVYLPPSYGQGSRRYPVVFMLHGWQGTYDSFLDTFPVEFDRLIRSRRAAEMIAVFVDGNNAVRGSFYRNSVVTGDYETYIAKDLVGQIDTRYRTIGDVPNRAIAGYSMGGYGALHLAMNYPDIFSVAASHAGYYDTGDSVTDAALKTIARTKPVTAGAVAGMNLQASALFPLLPAAVPNPEKPPFYYDSPYTYENGVYTLDTDLARRLLEADIVHGDLPRYLSQPTRLLAMQVVHGTADGLSPVSQARTLRGSLVDGGVTHVYEEHGGGHVFLLDRLAEFLTKNLAGAQLYIDPPRLTLVGRGTGAKIVFSTLVGVEYQVEQAGLDRPIREWTSVATIQGTGQSVEWPIPPPTGAFVLRVVASNKSP